MLLSSTNSTSLQPKVVVIRRRPNQGFGFTLRHFIAYPPEDDPSWLENVKKSNEFYLPYHKKGMETIFIKEVHPNSPAFHANLQTGDRILMVNQTPISGLAYSTIVSMIKQTPIILTLHVVPKECDVLQMHYDSIAHAPESNRPTTSLCTEMIREPKITTPISSQGSSQHIVKDILRSNKFQSLPDEHFEKQKNIISNSRGWLENQKRINHFSYPRESFLNSNNDIACLPSVSVLSNQPQSETNLYSPNGACNTDLMVRLRQSIKQKEEFLKSPAFPAAQPQSHFFPTSFVNEACPQTRMNAPSNNLSNTYQENRKALSQQIRPLNAQMVSGYSSRSTFATRDNVRDRTLMASFDPDLAKKLPCNNSETSAEVNKNKFVSQSSPSYGMRIGLDFSKSEAIQDTGVTNEVFERKLISRFQKGFDPFKPLSINTSSIDESIVASSNLINENEKNAHNSIHDYLPKLPIVKEPNETLKFYGDQSNPDMASSIVKMVGTSTVNEDLKKDKTENIYDKVTTTDEITENFRRPKVSISSAMSENKHMRRISYLRATNNDNLEQSESSLLLQTSKESSKYLGHEFIETSRGIEDTKVNAFETEVKDDTGSVTLHSSNKDLKYSGNENESFETELEMKTTCINGKRYSDYRSWKQVKIEIQGDSLKIFVNRTSKTENNVIILNLRNLIFCDESIDKKKNVFRLQSKTHSQINNQGSSDRAMSIQASNLDTSFMQTDILFKTKNYAEMKRIFGLLQWKSSLLYDNEFVQDSSVEHSKVLEIPNNPTVVSFDDQEIRNFPLDSSPSSSTTKYDTDVSNSTSPSMKARKSSYHKTFPEKELGSPKSKNWKDLLFRRGGTASNNSDLSSSPSAFSKVPTVGSIGVPLKNCPMSKNNAFVPNIVEVCTNIVETKGLGIVGIYRIPGNKAAISELSEQVNKVDFSWDQCNTDVRWEDVNVVSSLLKLFIRSLPDALLPSSFYINFIEADKKSGSARVKELKELMSSLPRHSYETLKHLIRHLNRISLNCEVNLMEPKNLAIIFGPSIIRTPNDTLEIAVKDMKHQCRIVELLVSQYDYFFENGEFPNIPEPSGNNIKQAASGEINTSSYDQSQEDQTNMLLHNVSKIERLSEKESSKTSRFIPQLRRRTQNKRGGVSSDTYSGESVLSLDNSKTVGQMENEGASNIKTINTTSSVSHTTTTHFIKTTNPVASKKKDRISLLGSRSYLRKSSPDDKDSGNKSSNKSGKDLEQRNSIDVSLFVSDDDSTYSRLSDTGSMSLTTVTDTLDSKLKNLRSGSESNDENDFPEYQKNRRHTLGQPLYMHSENIPYADESPERHFNSYNSEEYLTSLIRSRSHITDDPIGTDNRMLTSNIHCRPIKLQHSVTMPVNANSNSISNVASPLSNNSALSNKSFVSNKSGVPRNSHISRQQSLSEDDSEGSTTSNPKENLLLKCPSVYQERYGKKRRDHKLFRSASFNCRNHSTKSSNLSNGQANCNFNLTKDEKTDMNLTKKRQIQIKQNRSIKRRHTVGGPNDYSSQSNNINCNQCFKKNINRTTSRRISIPVETNIIVNNNKNCNDKDANSITADTSPSRSDSEDHSLEVGVRTKNTNKVRY